MKRIGILTWHKSLNHGAVLQAYATQNFLKKNNIDSLVLDYERTVVDQRSRFFLNVQRLKKIMNGGVSERSIIQKMDKEKRIEFNEFIKNDLSCGNVYSKEKMDCTIIGSDMVFSLIQGYNPYMFGIGINSDYIVSYAASAGGTKKNLAKKMGVDIEIKNALNSFKSIGYRDKETKEFIDDLGVETKSFETIDPVLLYGFDIEKNTWNTGKWNNKVSYLLVYSYHGFLNEKKEYKQIQKYAKENGLKIISCGYYHKWADENINAGPKEFLEMFVNANCVVTDTFHGTIFSIICRKNFVSIIRDNGFKLRYLLNESGLSKQVAENNNQIYSILISNIDYSYCDKWLKDKRKESGKYLLDNINCLGE